MLPAAARLRHQADFATTIRSGRRVARGPLVLHLRPSAAETAASPRVGFVVSRAVGHAVTRNTVRRRLRHVLRARTQTLDPGATLVVRALPGAAALDSTALGQLVDEALTRLTDAKTREPAR